MMTDETAERIMNDCYELLRQIVVKRPRGDKVTRLVSNARVLLFEAIETIAVTSPPPPRAA